MERTQFALAGLVGKTGGQLPKGLRLNGIRIWCVSAHYRKAVYCFPAKIAGIESFGRKFLPRTGSHLINLFGKPSGRMGSATEQHHENGLPP